MEGRSNFLVESAPRRYRVFPPYTPACPHREEVDTRCWKMIESEHRRSTSQFPDGILSRQLAPFDDVRTSPRYLQRRINPRYTGCVEKEVKIRPLYRNRFLLNGSFRNILQPFFRDTSESFGYIRYRCLNSAKVLFCVFTAL